MYDTLTASVSVVRGAVGNPFPHRIYSNKVTDGWELVVQSDDVHTQKK